MRSYRPLLAALALVVCVLRTGGAEAALILSPDGNTVYDSANTIGWLANGDLAATNTFGLNNCQTENAPNSQPCVNTNGTMNYQSALQWVQAMNNSNYEGHNNWQLPTNPTRDSGCTQTGPMPAQNNFGFGCSGGALGDLYYNQLGLKAPNSAVPPATNTVGPFINFQPNLYWTGSMAPGTAGYHTFSFATGYQSADTLDNFLDVLPMIPGTPVPGGGPLQSIMNGQAVFDPSTGATWSADANLAYTIANSPSLLQAIGMQLCTGPGNKPSNPPICINANGTMDEPSSLVFAAALNTMVVNGVKGYLGLSGWELPPAPDATGCAFGCTTDPADPLTYLFYNGLGLTAGTSAAPAADVPVGPFINVQPYLYWSCEASSEQSPVTSPCANVVDVGNSGADFQFDFSFGNGFEGSDHSDNDEFVSAYYVNSVPEASTLSLFGAGVVGAVALRRRKTKA